MLIVWGINFVLQIQRKNNKYLHWKTDVLRMWFSLLTLNESETFLCVIQHVLHTFCVCLFQYVLYHTVKWQWISLCGLHILERMIGWRQCMTTVNTTSPGTWKVLSWLSPKWRCHSNMGHKGISYIMQDYPHDLWGITERLQLLKSLNVCSLSLQTLYT